MQVTVRNGRPTMKIRSRTLRAMCASMAVAMLAIPTFGCNSQPGVSDPTSEASPSSTPAEAAATPTTTSKSQGNRVAGSPERTDTAPPDPAYTRLQTVVPPCVPWPGSTVDPCKRRSSWEDHTPFIETAIQIPDIIPTFKEKLLERASTPFWVTQFVVRAIVVPDSTRCAWSEVRRSHSIEYVGDAVRVTREGKSYCYFDLAVNEYLHGNGPARLTVNFWTEAWGGISPCDSECLAESADYIEEAIRYEGVEWIVLLGGPEDLGTEVWLALGFNDVQQRDDGEVVVVRRIKGAALRATPPEYAELNLSRLEWTLAEYRNVISDAFKSFNTLTGGRTGNVRDRLGRLPPFFAEDAGPDGFTNFITSTKMLDGTDVTPSPPPPIPGEGDPSPSGLTTNDIIATRVAGGVKVPGGLTDFETPAPTLGDEPTATATATEEPTATPTEEPTATATTVTEVADTPTPEPTTADAVEDTPTPEPTATVEPTATPEPTPEPTATVTPEPTPEPTDTPTPESEQPLGPGAEETPEDPIDPGTGGNGQPGAGPGA